MRLRQGFALVALLAIVVAAALALAGCQAASGATRTLYHCPMHPDYVSDRPGDCPICGMRLVAADADSAASNAGPAGTAATPVPGGQRAPATRTVYVCPMHHDVQSDKPGTCPKCGMDLEKKEIRASSNGSRTPSAPAPAVVSASRPEAVQQPSPRTGEPPMPDMPGMPGMPAPPASGEHQHQQPSPGSGRAPVHTEQADLAGVRTATAANGALTGTIRAVGTVVTPETGVRQVTTKVGGWVQKLYVNATGRPVRAGEPLFDLYSPELLASQEEYLHARQVAAEFDKSAVPEVQRGGRDLVASARRRLELFDVPMDFLARLDESGKAQRTVTFRAPFGGYVLEKSVVEGQKIEPGMNLMTIADLSRAWVTAQVYEAEAAAARPGRTVHVALPYDDSVRLTGRIDLVYPTLDTESRTLKVRLQFPNPGLVLKPGMFVNVELDAQRAQGIVVPDSALIDTGTRQVVFVQTQPGHFEPREVQAGLRSQGQVILRSGVQAGEQVAVSANFLLDSESRLRAAVR